MTDDKLVGRHWEGARLRAPRIVTHAIERRTVLCFGMRVGSSNCWKILSICVNPLLPIRVILPPEPAFR
jgi:hypothetical protein